MHANHDALYARNGLTLEQCRLVVGKIKLPKSTIEAIRRDGRELTDPAEFYHAGLAGANSPLGRGYVGVTTNGCEARFKQHQKEIRTNHINKERWKTLTGDPVTLDDVEFTVVQLPPEFATLGGVLLLEKAFRPKQWIEGCFNRSAGGKWNGSDAISWFSDSDLPLCFQYKKSTGQWAVSIGTVTKLLTIYAPRNMPEAESKAGLQKIVDSIRVTYSQKYPDGSAPDYDWCKQLAAEGKKALGWLVFKRSEAPRVTGGSFFVDCQTGRLLNPEAHNQHKARDLLGVNQAHMPKLIATFLGTPKRFANGRPCYVRSLPYRNGRLKLAAFVPTNADPIYAPDLSPEVRETIAASL